MRNKYLSGIVLARKLLRFDTQPQMQSNEKEGQICKKNKLPILQFKKCKFQRKTSKEKQRASLRVQEKERNSSFFLAYAYASEFLRLIVDSPIYYTTHRVVVVKL